MLTTNDFLDRIKSSKNINSEYGLAKVLTVSESNLRSYRKKKNRPDDATAARIAAVLEIDPGYVLACIHAERSPEGPIRSLWSDVAHRLQGASALLFALVILSTGIVFSPDASAMAKGTQRVESGQTG